MEAETIDAPPTVDAPREVSVAHDMKTLTLQWHDGAPSVISAETLRSACWCAWCRTDRVLNRFPDHFDGVAIETVKALGGYAIHIAFTDGHARGIFPWTYLKDIADGRPLPDSGRYRAPSEIHQGSNAVALAAPGSKA
jgi:DUF971 family protein